jgi:TatA/E family protein of Tat protein translocase
MLNIGPLELILILLIALVVVGPRKLPDLGRTIGNGLREFRKAQDEVRKSLQLEDLQDVRREIAETQRGVRQALRFDEVAATPPFDNGASAQPASASAAEPSAQSEEPPTQPAGPASRAEDPPASGSGADGE